MPFGMILEMLSFIPPPVICAHPLINFKSINLDISLTINTLLIPMSVLNIFLMVQTYSKTL